MIWLQAVRDDDQKGIPKIKIKRTSLQERHLAALLVGDRQYLLQPSIAISEFVSPPLLSLYPLPTGCLFPRVGKRFSHPDTHIVVVVRNRTAAASASGGARRGGGRVVPKRVSVDEGVGARR